MDHRPQLPEGGIDGRKYAALALGLGMARGAIVGAREGDEEGARRLFHATAKIAQALGFTEAELAIDWTGHLTPQEVRRITGRA
jgi:hypothetical protein